jgi:SAM-dependent methyltransferase
MMDLLEYNRRAWDAQVKKGNEWTIPVTPAAIQAARAGEWSIVLTPSKPVPREWFPPLAGLPVLCLAGSGGQQAPILAAAGATVTVLDNSPAQLAQDRTVAERDGLEIRTVQGDMADLGCFGTGTFGLIVHPCSNCFVPDVRPVWREAFRVLANGGALLSGFLNPARYIFDEALHERGELKVRHALPYSDLTSITEEERERLKQAGEPFCFSHTLEDLIGGQLDAGFFLERLYEDSWPGQLISSYMPSFIATRGLKRSRE